MFQDRFTAGRLLAKKLAAYKNKKDALILAIPRGALQIGYALAQELHVPLDIVLTKKIPYPGNEELAIGAVGVQSIIVDEELVSREGISQDYIARQVKELRKKLQERYVHYVGKRKQLSLQGKTVILIDDGVAMGSTMLAAIAVVRKEKPKKIIVAVPVGPVEALAKLRAKADEVICLHIPEFFPAIGAFYQEFPQVEDEEAIALLRKANASRRKEES